jgi:putative dimethyl sulfoxide reductase chaperone
VIFITWFGDLIQLTKSSESGKLKRVYCCYQTSEFNTFLSVEAVGGIMAQTNTQHWQESWVDTILGEALLFGTLGKLLNQIPQSEEIKELIQQEIFNELPFGDGQPESEAGASLLQVWTSRLKENFADQDFEELKADYTRLFLGPGKVLAPPWESVYYSEERLLFQEQTLKVRTWYRRFGLESEKIHNEPDDHIALELAFLTHLAGLGLQALHEDDREAFQGYLDVQRQFLNEHPLRWAPIWQQEVDKHAHTDFYRGLALLVVGALKALDSTLAAEAARENA